MNFADPKTCTYYAYRFHYCQTYFYLVDPKDFTAGGAVRTYQWRNPETNESVWINGLKDG